MKASPRFSTAALSAILLLAPVVHSDPGPPLLSVGNLVFRDLDNDGLYEPLGNDGQPGGGDDEIGIANVGLSLFRDLGESGRDGADEYIGGASTDPNGEFRFDGLPPGDYLIEVSAWNFNLGGPLLGLMSSPGAADPDNDTDNDDNGIDSTMPVNWGVSSPPITLTSGGEPAGDGDDANGNRTLDLGFYSPPDPPILVLGGSVFRDLDADGVKDPGEPGLANVGVSIIQVLPDGSEIHQGGSSTDPDGNYRFHGRPAGRYYVRIDNWNFSPGSSLDNLASSPGVEDADNNGLDDDNGQDSRIPGNDGLRSHVLTLAHGTEPGTGLDGDDANGNLTVDFGLVTALTLGDLVFLDADQNGLFNPGAGDAGVDGVALHLFSDQNGNGLLDTTDPHLASTTTAAGGRYSFVGLAPGGYLVLVGAENFASGAPLAGKATSPLDETDPNADGDNNDNGLVRPPYGVASAAITLVSGSEPVTEDADPGTNLTLDFGFQTARPLTLGDLVFRDLDNDGRFEPAAGETGIAGVAVELYRDADESNSVSPGDALVASTTTDLAGRFEFTGLDATAGEHPYLLLVPAVNFLPGGALAGWITSEPTFGQGTDGWTDGLDHGWFLGADQGVSTWQFHLNPSSLPLVEDGDPNTDLTADLGFTPEFRVGNLVWADLDNNGTRDPGEPGIDSVEVQLWRDDGDGVWGDGDSHVQTVGTAGGGRYEFRHLAFGNYFVAIPPSMFEAGRVLFNRATSTGNDPAPDPNTDLDHDDNGALRAVFGGDYVASDLLVLSEGDEPTIEDGDPNTNLTVDFGFRQGPLPSIGNLVWNDLNQNGQHDDGEPGLAGVGVSLYADDGDGQPNSGNDYGVRWTTTGSDGLFQFTGVQPGQYFIRIEYGSFAPGQPLFGFVSSAGSADPDTDPEDNDDNGLDSTYPLYQAVHSPVFAVAAGSGPTNDGDDANGNQTVDFGFRVPSPPPVMSLGNLVWRDLNGDGLRQPGEPGIPGVGLNLSRDDGNGIRDGADPYVAGTGTDANGEFHFVGLPPGNYILEVGSWNFTADGPLFGLASSPGVALSGEDQNDDDNGLDEPLTVARGVSTAPVTLANGGEPETGVDGDGPDGNQTIDFGFYAPPNPAVLVLGGTVWRDDGNSVRDGGEPGIANVQIAIIRDGGDGLVNSSDDQWMFHVYSDSQGHYRATGLPAGSYFTRVESYNFQVGSPLFGLLSAPGQVPADSNLKDDDTGLDEPLPVAAAVWGGLVTLTNGGEPDFAVDGDGPDGNLTVDFGFAAPPNPPVLSFGGTVWRDDGNSVRDGGEPGIVNVQIAIIRDGGDGILNSGDDRWLFHTYTDAQGRYQATGLPAGSYFARVEGYNFQAAAPLFGLLSAPDHVPADSDLKDDDSGLDDPQPVARTVASTLVTLANGSEPAAGIDGDGPDGNQTVDFGFYSPSNPPVLTLGGAVWRDNGDGVRSPGEPGVANVGVAIIRDGGDGVPNSGDDIWLFHAWTDSEGRYRATGLPPGGYFARVDTFNLQPGSPLDGWVSVPGAADPNTDVVGDDNGTDSTQPAGTGIATRLMTLTNGQEPDSPVDGDDANGNLTLDFAFLDLPGGPSLSLGGTVFTDPANDGLLNDADAGVDGVGVELWIDNGDGVLGAGDGHVGALGTTGGGQYRFDGLVPADYLVVVPRGNLIAGPLAGAATSTGNGPAPDPNDDVDGDDNGADTGAFGQVLYGVATGLVSLRSASEPTAEDGDPNTNLTIDLGFVLNGAMTLGGTVFKDDDNSGSFEPGTESGIPGVTVELWVDTNRDGRLSDGDWAVTQVQTDLNGTWSVRVPPGDDYLTVIRYQSFMPNRPLNGLRSSTGNGPAPDPDDDVDGDDSGSEYAAFGRVFFAVASAPITLAFGTEPTDDGDADPDTNLSLDFGFYPGPTSAIGDLVFLDANNSGQLDPGEAGIGGVRVFLAMDSNGDGVFGSEDEILSETTTTTDGRFVHAGLPQGDYLLALPYDNFWVGRPLNGLRSSTGGGIAPDPDADPTDGDDNGDETTRADWPSVSVATRAFQVRLGSDFSQNVDFGCYAGPTLAIGGTVFRDENNDGRFEPASGEGGIGNVEIGLYLDTGDSVMNEYDPQVGLMRTDPNGDYRFTGLMPGRYHVSINYWEQFYGRALTGLRTSSGNDPAPDPDNDVDHDDNGAEFSAWGMPVAGIASAALTLSYDGEPDAAVDGDGTDSNLTVDFGFHAVTGTTFVVNSAGDGDDGSCDSGDCTLREAINAANRNAGQDTIRFNIGGGGLQTIQSGTPLPDLIEPVILDATTQPGYGGLPLIELDGSAAGPNAVGLRLQGGFSAVTGFAVNRFALGGIVLQYGDQNRVQACFIGTDPTGTLARGNAQPYYAGVAIDQSDDNLIGGTTPAERNLISGNSIGLQINAGSRNRVQGNFIGTDLTGTIGLGNTFQSAVQVSTGADNTIGGAEPGAGNLISGNGGPDYEATRVVGVSVGPATNTRIAGNFIGTDVTGTAALPNFDGISAGGTGTVIGGIEPGSRNLISGNRSDGASLWAQCMLAGNLIGTDITGARALPNERIGVVLYGADSLVGGTSAAARNIISGNGGTGISAAGGGREGCRIIGNWIGLDLSGTVALGNGGLNPTPTGLGIAVYADEIVIGGSLAGEGNVIAGHSTGIDVRGERNVIQGNRIGTDPTGTIALPNTSGVNCYDPGRDNLIGGASAGAGNLISGNHGSGIYLAGANVAANRILGNRIGTDVTGLLPLGNNEAIALGDSHDNTIGGVGAGEANTIAFNRLYGVGVSGSAALNNVIRGNAIHSNGGGAGDWLGLDLMYGATVSGNDPGDTDEGPNHLQNYPVLHQAAASATALAVEGRLDGTPSRTFTIDFYANAACDPTGYGEGERHLAAVEVTTDAAGEAPFHVNLSSIVAPGEFVTATATDPAGNTSEFSACRPVIPEGAPTILEVATQGAADQVLVMFSESVDPATAGDKDNYVVTCGRAVLSATVVDARSVLLALDGPVSGLDCAVTVSGVRDLAEPPNTIVAGSSRAIFDALGRITRREYWYIPGGNDLWQLTSNPRFPDAPSVIDYRTLLESPENVGENLGVQMLGYVHPPVTGDYVFYLAADERAELYVSSDDQPRNKRLVATEYQPHLPREWTNDNRRQVISEASVFTPGTFFIELEDYNHDAGQHQAAADSMPYFGGASKGLSAAAEVDYHDQAASAEAVAYRARDQGVADVANTVNGDPNAWRGSWLVSVNYKIGWTAAGDWMNYTRDFGPAQDYYAYLSTASGYPVVDSELAQVTGDPTQPAQTVVPLGRFPGNTSGNYGLMGFLPLRDADGNRVTVHLGGVQTLRWTAGAYDQNPDYLALVPVGAATYAERPENRTAPLYLEAGRRYYLEARMKEGNGADNLAVAWQRPGDPAPANGDAPIPGESLEAWVDPDVTTAPFVHLGGLVFRDENNNGRFDPPTDIGIPGVNVELRFDQDNNNVLHHGDWTVANAVTDAQGRYRFDGLHPASYLVVINKWEQYYGRALTGLRTSTGNDPAPDPDDDMVGEDHGYEDTFYDQPPGELISSRALTLTVGSEPGPDVDGDGTDSNQTLDLGFAPLPVGATFVVTSADDSGPGTLREAIALANTSPGKDTILFDIPGAGLHTIQPTSWLPELYEAVDLDATSQPGYSGTPLVELDGSLAGGGVIGLRVYGGFSTVRGLCINRFTGGGLHLAYGGQTTIAACFIGTDATGTAAPMPFQGCYCYGGLIVDSKNNRIGGYVPADRNIISGYDTGIWIRSEGTVVVGNYIGTDLTGTLPVPNSLGIYIEGQRDNLIGGAAPGARNLISGNQAGVGVYGTGNRIQGNYIGTEVTGVAALPNQTGIYLYAAIDNLVGGTAPGEGNVISGNGTAMDIRGSNNNRVQGNLIGLDATGTQAVPGSGAGLGLNENDADNLIGGTAPGARNVFAGLGWRALNLSGSTVVRTVVQGNYFGTDLAGTTAIPNLEGIFLVGGTSQNTIGGIEPGAGNLVTATLGGAIVLMDEGTTGNAVRGNAVFANGIPDPNQLGIDLGYNGVSPNDPGDADAGPNLGQNFPELVYAASSAESTMIEGSLASAPDTTFALDFYASAECDPPGYGEGRQYLGSAEVVTDAGGNASFVVNLPVAVAPGQALTATATDPAHNTSEFSACQLVRAESPPMLLGAVTRGRPAFVELTFSESLDPATALDPGNYSLDCGVGIAAITFGTSARSVWLTLNGTPVPGCLVTVQGVTDRADPPNPIAAVTQAAVLDSQGVITRKLFRGIGGGWVADLTNHPNFPNSPTELDYAPSFEAPSDIDDSYGTQLVGYLTPPVTGDYVFYLAADDTAELYLSTDADAANKARVAQSVSPRGPRAWNDGAELVPRDTVLNANSFFIEAEDFDHDGGQYVSGVPIGMTGQYDVQAYANLGTMADQDIDWHEVNAGNDAPNYRPTTAVETTVFGDPYRLDRGTFEVTVNFKVGWNDVGDWANYTREFPAPAQDYFVYGRLASGGSPMAAMIEEVTAGRGTPSQTTQKLGEFNAPATGDWDRFVFVPLRDDSGQMARANLGGVRTLRYTTLPGNADFDYLALVPASDPAPTFEPENRSAPIHLVAGQKYYVEALMKENSGSDYLGVAWQLPGAPPPANGDPPIPGAFLSSLQTSGPVRFVQEPLDQTADEHGSATFSAQVDGTPPYSAQWYRNGVPLPGQTGLTLTLAGLSAAESGAQIQVVVDNAFSSTPSRVATLTVIPDTTPPTVTMVSGSATLDSVTVQFSEPLLPASASDPAHYLLSGMLSVLGATLEADQRTVRLVTTPQQAGVRYALTVDGVLDTAATPNAVPAGNQVSFTAWVLARGFVLHEFYAEVYGNSIDALRQHPAFPNQPTVSEALTRFEWPPDGGNEGGSNYGNRISGWLLPPVSGFYRFHVCSDDPSEVYLSTDDQAANKSLLCYEPQWNNPRMYRTTERRNPAAPENVSAPVWLDAGQRYYIEALHTEGGGGDNLSLAWQLPGAAEVQDGDLPISGDYLETMVNPDVLAPVLVAITPNSKPAGSPETVIAVQGGRFTPASQLLWDGSPRPTTYVDAEHLTATLSAADLNLARELTAVLVQVRGLGGLHSDPVTFTITGALVVVAQSDVATSGEIAAASTAPTMAGEAGVAADVENLGSPDPVTVSAATYSENPASTDPVFDVGGGYVDLLVAGADPEDSAVSRFFYPDTVTGAAEATLMLLYFNGTAWVPVLSSGGLQPLKDTTDNLDGTVSGGRFTVTFDASSTPALTQLTGTPFTLSLPQSAPPVATEDIVLRRPDDSVKIPIAKLLSNDSDPDLDPLSLTGFSPGTSQGGAVVRQGSWLIYTPPAGLTAEDVFEYTITDGRDGLATGIVRVRVIDDTDPSHNRVSVTVADGKVSLRFAGIPGRTYRVQYSTDLATWWPLPGAESVVCGPDGLMTVADPVVTDPLRFYRTVYP